ncbi:CRISPR-associated protein Cas4 [Sedimentisphaera salicampi]|uniref:CRISPR-associated exonuclease Cas4 n=1 Tax=Sedimentisphaera salicampi TaxID=1941349 RepID=A0A1W6LLL2_9BACT|nr:CRISPR-associated protein Cas4 [Sedimentisphaera salicampi]ARN56661.1 CRISPR-associated protein Cas4 [Sedimentisphaera salicampi]
MSYSEEQFLQLSGLQHYQFCKRQWGLIHIELLWAENFLTASGNLLHSRVHKRDTEMRGGVLMSRGLRLHSYKLGLAGQADIVQFERSDSSNDKLTCDLPAFEGRWKPCPVEFKHGKPKISACDRIQLCAQAVCLEEMLEVQIDLGQIFYGKTRRREDVEFTEQLRDKTAALANEIHKVFDLGVVPKVTPGPKCKSCSLRELCLPKTTGIDKKVKQYIERILSDETDA